MGKNDCEISLVSNRHLFYSTVVVHDDGDIILQQKSHQNRQNFISEKINPFFSVVPF